MDSYMCTRYMSAPKVAMPIPRPRGTCQLPSARDGGDGGAARAQGFKGFGLGCMSRPIVPSPSRYITGRYYLVSLRTRPKEWKTQRLRPSLTPACIPVPSQSSIASPPQEGWSHKPTQTRGPLPSHSLPVDTRPEVRVKIVRVQRGWTLADGAVAGHLLGGLPCHLSPVTLARG